MLGGKDLTPMAHPIVQCTQQNADVVLNHGGGNSEWNHAYGGERQNASAQPKFYLKMGPK